MITVKIVAAAVFMGLGFAATAFDDGETRRAVFAQMLHETQPGTFTAIGRDWRTLSVTYPAATRFDLDALTSTAACAYTLERFVSTGVLDTMRRLGFTMILLRGNTKQHSCPF